MISLTQKEFHDLIDYVLAFLYEDCKRRPQCYKKSGEEFEPLIVQAVQMALQSLGICADINYTPGGHGFPDIVLYGANGAKYGIEVKSSTSSGKSWKINGNSVMGTTKEAGILENVIVFGKLRGVNSEFRARNYEQSVVNVGVTHSPRFLIDLDTPIGESFFEKSGITYNQLNSVDNPIKLITDYFLSIGQKAWWLAESTPATIRMFGSLPKNEQNYLMGYAFAHFPELFSHSSSKFYRFMSWLSSEKSIVDAALRDRFTAGGRVDLNVHGTIYHSVPQLFNNFYKYRDYVLLELNNADLEKLSEDWGHMASDDCCERIGQLIDIICNSIMDDDLSGINKRQLVTDILT